MSNVDNIIVDNNDDVDIIQESDDIAKKITEILIEGFKLKNNREPTNEEIGTMLDELDEDAINNLLNGGNNEEEDDEEGEGEGEEVKEESKEEVVVEKNEQDGVEDKKRELEVTEDKTSDKKQKVADVSEVDENVDLTNALVA
jgi:hypothetical protein